MPPREDDEILTQERIAFLSDPDTTRIEVEEQLGEPPGIGRGLSYEPVVYCYWYRWRNWSFVYVDADGNTGMPEHDKTVLLLIEFDDAGRVLRHGCYKRPKNKSVYDITNDFLSDPLPKYLTKQVQLPKD